MERPYEQIRRMVKLFEYNRLKLRFRNEDERARFIDGWAERFCETDDAEWNIAVTIMTARRREPNFYNMEKALREAQGIRRERRLQDEWRAKDKGSLQQDQRANNNAAEQGREENENNGANAQISTAAETSSVATTANMQKRALQLQGSYNLKTTPSPVAPTINPLNGLKYETLGDYKRTFEYLRTIRSVVIKQNEEDEQDSAIYEIFNRLNTGGQNLTAQEIRMSLFYSKFYEMLLRINKNEQWRSFLGQPSTDLHFKDVEILLRSFAMLVHHCEYKAPMTKFLNSFSKEATKFNNETNEYWEKLFESFIESCRELNDKDFFSGSGKFNISLFESVFVVVCENAFNGKKLVNGYVDRESLNSLKVNEQFIESTREGVASRKSVSSRMEAASLMIRLR